ncbi:hypothetical protein QQF64_002918 [Cirrhinus molitorella]|uniref:Uncharacterized protein n=2 Tax=Cirrhinus molitorella TaxID=172907 RepID=A0ABR3MRI3_9TELE|nr:hypothetical protein Q8A67_023131 [Cirrhinus molitorella]
MSFASDILRKGIPEEGGWELSPILPEDFRSSRQKEARATRSSPMVVQVEDQLSNHLTKRQDPAETSGLFSPGNHSRVASVGCGLQMDSPVTMI